MNFLGNCSIKGTKQVPKFITKLAEELQLKTAESLLSECVIPKRKFHSNTKLETFNS